MLVVAKPTQVMVHSDNCWIEWTYTYIQDKIQRNNSLQVLPVMRFKENSLLIYG